MHLFDYHLHTEHSMDCDMPMETLCEAAQKAGITEICLTEHTEFGHPAPGSDAPPRIHIWLADIRRAQEAHPNLTIRAGIEVGDNPACRDRIKAWHAALPLDFLLLSLHLVDGEDPYFPGFFDGKAQAPTYRRYAEAKLESALAWEPEAYDSFAHLGYCAKFAPYPLAERMLRWHHAPDTFDALFRRLAEGGKALEINTSGLGRMGETIPGKDLILRFRELGGEFVTIGSDAHQPAQVGRGIAEAAALARACGIRYALTFERRRPIPVAL